MKKFVHALIVFICVILINESYSQESEDAAAKIEQFENNNDGLGQYNFKFVTSNDIERSESGRLDEDGNYIVEGYYSYIGDNGKKYYMSYVADKTGYHPTVVSDRLPQIPVVASLPSAVVASLLGG